jgi:hypothetical protein
MTCVALACCERFTLAFSFGGWLLADSPTSALLPARSNGM